MNLLKFANGGVVDQHTWHMIVFGSCFGPLSASYRGNSKSGGCFVQLLGQVCSGWQVFVRTLLCQDVSVRMSSSVN